MTCDCGAVHTSFPQAHYRWCSAMPRGYPSWVVNGWMTPKDFDWLVGPLSVVERDMFERWVGGEPMNHVQSGPVYVAIMTAISAGYG